MSGGGGPAPFCHGVQGTKSSAYLGGCVSRDSGDAEYSSIMGTPHQRRMYSAGRLGADLLLGCSRVDW